MANENWFIESTLTYGWAILVVIIVGVVLWQMGIFKAGLTEEEAKGVCTEKCDNVSMEFKEVDWRDCICYDPHCTLRLYYRNASACIENIPI